MTTEQPKSSMSIEHTKKVHDALQQSLESHITDDPLAIEHEDLETLGKVL